MNDDEQSRQRDRAPRTGLSIRILRQYTIERGQEIRIDDWHRRDLVRDLILAMPQLPGSVTNDDIFRLAAFGLD